MSARRLVPLICIWLLPSWPAPALAGSSHEDLLKSAAIAELLDSANPPPRVDLAEAEEVRRLVWEKLRGERLSSPARRREHEDKTLRLGNAAMRFEVFKAGARPKEGYPLYIALHGGGGAAPTVNDRQWRGMAAYYRASVDVGIYVAPRGVSDTWDLHFRPESYPLYDRLIENMILFEEADPSRVYILGFSAGGDGVYQIAPRLADRLAAANMSAGHPNGLGAKNLHHVPFLLQVGERDAAYGRNRETVKFRGQLAALKTEYPDGFLHEVFVHRGKPHNFRDNDPRRALQEIFADPTAWLEGRESPAAMADTNAVAWLERHRRDPLPPRVIWDLGTYADRSGAVVVEERASGAVLVGRQRYWLAMGRGGPDALGAKEVIARIDASRNAVVIEKPGDGLRILLSARRLDLSKPVTVEVGSTSFAGMARPNLGTMLRTAVERGDPDYIFEAECGIERRGDGWAVTGLEVAR